MNTTRSLLLVLLVATVISAQDTRKRVLINEVQKAPRILAEAAMRIEIDTSTSDNNFKSGNALVNKYIFAKKLIIRAAAYYKSALKVINPTTTISFAEFDTIHPDRKVPGRNNVNADLFVVFNAYNDDKSTTAASAAPISQDSTTGRTIVGDFNVNLVSINPTKANELNHFGTFVHEFYHIIVFNDQLFSRYIDGSGNVIGKSTIIGSFTGGSKTFNTYKGTNVLTFAKTYLGDTSLTEILLENGGGSGSAGSHWEYMYFPTDFMSPIDTIPSILSKLSLLMAKDSGWYNIDETFTEEMTYAKGVGSGFMTGNCPAASVKGFCASGDNGKAMCSPDYTYKARCYTDITYSDGCYFLQGDYYCNVDDVAYYKSQNKIDDTFEVLGDSSRCADLTFNSEQRASCGTATCASNVITWNFKNGASCSCTVAQQGTTGTCTGYTGSINCPADVAGFCNTLSARCPKDCSGKGFCLGGSGTRTCFCMYGYGGTDCSTNNPNEPDLTPIQGSGNSMIYGLALSLVLSIMLVLF